MLRVKGFLLFIGLFGLLISCSQKLGGSHSDDLIVVGFYNLENLFDTINTPDVRDEEFTPDGRKEWTEERYEKKLAMMSKVIRSLGDTVGVSAPAIMGLCEVENRRVVEDLISHQNLVEYGYEIVHQDSPDKRGIDVALLYQPKLFEVENVKAVPLYIYDQEDQERIYTRDQLLVSGRLADEKVHLLVNHWPSRYGGEERSRPSRKAAAQLTRSIVDSLKQFDKAAKVIIMGDLNDDPHNVSIKDELRAVKKEELQPGDLFNPYAQKHQDGEGTLCYRGVWNLFDQIILTQSLLDETSGIHFDGAYVFGKQLLREQKGKYKGYPLRTYVGNRYFGGYSDHFPVCIVLRK
ncbi:MAG: endonuclease/exonuclease/phosphatase family protein [Carboxylicivirga sp.]|jgi:predicted extracellular nuclease|nr:endonuclease/exonuclease/phosphatase family protein [Carboxylicivirga sp.]